MHAQDFSHIRNWVFDLDNTLYPPAMRLFDQIEVKMTDFVMRELGLAQPEANRLRQSYWDRYGTTMAGLIAEHGIEPEGYLHEVHDIDFSILVPDPDLATAIAALPGRRIIYTNASRPYAEKVLAARGLDGLFAAIYGVEHAGYRPKPERAAFETIFALDGLDPTTGVMFEDDPRNLAAPHDMGMRTVHVAPQALVAPHIHYHTDDLAGFLTRLQG
ncbi:pyrimidine 5'-nucleotidase [Gemmobacter serpentinus]|uniref:pyrimidine 5'-nucleotidase n=1 Tax=Gemmobacter serpentinus TaxID=2652247 RepID=UPI00124BE110|nr:pyrimidine 5'-nucleotidase [Gemmobacter serpentinus]